MAGVLPNPVSRISPASKVFKGERLLGDLLPPLSSFRALAFRRRGLLVALLDGCTVHKVALSSFGDFSTTMVEDSLLGYRGKYQALSIFSPIDSFL